MGDREEPMLQHPRAHHLGLWNFPPTQDFLPKPGPINFREVEPPSPVELAQVATILWKQLPPLAHREIPVTIVGSRDRPILTS